MASPTSTLTTQRPDLASSMEEFSLEMNQRDFIGTQVAPVINVAKQIGQFGKIPLEQLLSNRETRRAPGAGYSRKNWKFSVAQYATEEHGAEEPVDAREAEMYSDYFDAEMMAVQRARHDVLINAEKRLASMLFNATTWNGAALTTAITNEWDDAVNAVPLTDVEAAVRKVWLGSGLWPNALVINRAVFRNLRNCASIIDRIKYQGFQDVRASSITPQALAALFDLDYVIVAGGLKNTANDGQNASIAQVWSDEYAMVCRVATTNDPREPCVGRVFHWAADGSELNGTVEQYEEPQSRSDIYRVRHDVDEMVMYTEAGHLLSNVTT